MKTAQIDFSNLESKTLDNRFAGGPPGDVVAVYLPWIFAGAGLSLLIYLIYGGYQFMISRGNPQEMEAAKAKITYGLIGFVIVFTSYWIMQLLGEILGIIHIQAIFGLPK